MSFLGVVECFLEFPQIIAKFAELGILYEEPDTFLFPLVKTVPNWNSLYLFL